MVNIFVAGDCCPQTALQSHLSSDLSFDSVLGGISNLIRKADYSIVNLETPVLRSPCTPILKCGPNLQCADSVLRLLKWAGFNACTLANNHFFDFGDAGVKQTLDNLKEFGFDHVGGSEHEEKVADPLIKEINGLCFAFINCCEHEFSIAENGHGGANPLNPIQQYYSIKSVKNNVDYVIVIVHGGTEHYQLPSPRMQETYRFFIDAGADVVVNHHQHCFSGYEVYHGKPIFYGIGNFLYDHPAFIDKKFNQGILLKLLFAKERKEIKWETLPFFQCNGDFRVKLMGGNDEKKFNEAIMDLNNIISNAQALKNQYIQFVNNNMTKYKLGVEPYGGRILSRLYKEGLLPSTLRGQRLMVLINYIDCESHREKLMQVLKSL